MDFRRTAYAWLALVLVLAPAPLLAEPPSPEDAAATYLEPERPGTDFDLSRDQVRRRRSRGLRIAGLSLMGASVLTVGVMALVGLADHSCDQATGYACVDGPPVFASMGAVIAAPLFITGAVVTTTGLVRARGERERVTLSASGSGLRLGF